MSILCVPYHLDEHLPELPASLPAGADVTELTVDLPDPDVWSRLGRLYESVAGAVTPEVRPGSVQVVVSGDCAVSIGLTAGLQRAGLDPAVVWLDAHGDVQTLETTTSGYLGGMCLRFLVGYRPELIAERIGLRPPPEELVLLAGARDLDPPEVDYLASAPVRQVAVEELSTDLLPAGPLLVNLDLDVINPTELPGLRFPAAGGPDLAAVVHATRTILDSGRVAALNIACTWDPGRADPDGIRERLLATLLANLTTPA